MYLVVKSLLTVVALVCMGIVIGHIILLDLFLGFLLIISMFLMIFGDVLIGYKVTPFKALFEPTPKGMEFTEFQQLDGRVRFINTMKGPQGKRSFRVNGHDASVINDGKAQIRVPGGNIGFRSHEMIDRNVCAKRCKALEQMPGDNIKELFNIAQWYLEDKRKEDMADG